MTESQIEEKIVQLEDRFHLLTAALNYHYMFNPMFYIGERICINQERGAICDSINQLRHEFEGRTFRDYTIPESIEDKIKEVKPKLYNIYNL